MKHLTSKLFVFAALVLAAAGSTAFAKPEGIEGRRWTLAELNGRAAAGSKAFIEINRNQTKFTGSTGCNEIFGGVAVIGQRIDFSKIGTTRMACLDRSLSRQETEMVRVLDAAKRFRQAGGKLELIDRSRVVAVFRETREQTPPAADDLGAKKWVLESIAGRQTFKALPYAFVNFDVRKGSVGGDTSCNAFGGEFKAGAKSIAITDVISTMRACVEDDRMSVERELLDGLRRADRYEIAGNRLNLYDGRKLLLTLRGERK